MKIITIGSEGIREVKPDPRRTMKLSADGNALTIQGERWVRQDSLAQSDATWSTARDETLASPASGKLARGTIAAAFNDLAEAERDLLPIIGTEPVARDYLVAAYARKGEVRKALAQSEPRSTFLDALSKFPELSVSHRADTRVQMVRDNRGRLMVPVSISGVSAHYQLDTGSGKSLLSLTEAMRLGLKIEPLSTSVIDLGGARLRSHLAIAPGLSVGDMQLRNVPFWIVDDGLRGVPGIIGIDLLLAFQTVRWNAAGDFEIGFPPRARDVRTANLYFDGATPIVEAQSGKKRLSFVLDTGKDLSDLFPRFATCFPDLIAVQGRAAVFEINGYVGQSNLSGLLLPEVRLEVAGSEAALHPARLMLQKPPLWNPWHHGIIGLDLLNQARTVTLDFQAMRLTLE